MNKYNINIKEKSYIKNNPILKDINFNIEEGKITVILGPSGCGKSTLLSILSNIDTNYIGNINFNNKNIGYMLQEDSLLPWLTIKENTILGLKLTNKKIDYNKLTNLFKYYNLLNCLNKYPKELSGGEKQRAALIRTLMTNPDIILLDEPLSSLDYKTKLEIENYLYNLSKIDNKTLLIVTHDIEEAISIGNKIITLSKKPTTIKNIYNINLEENINPKENRYDKRYKYYFEKILKDLDE